MERLGEIRSFFLTIRFTWREVRHDLLYIFKTIRFTWREVRHDLLYIQRRTEVLYAM